MRDETGKEVNGWDGWWGIAETYSVSNKCHHPISQGWEPYQRDSAQLEPILRKA